MSEMESLCGNVSIAGTSFLWEFKKTHFMGRQVGEFLTSPTFYTLNAKWQIKLYPKGIDEGCKNDPSAVLLLLNSVKPIQIHISASLLLNNGTSYKNITMNQPGVFTTGSKWEIKKVCEYDKTVMEYFNYYGNTMFKFMYNFRPAIDTNFSEPLTFSDALYNQQFSDVKFAVEDKEIYAHKIILANRSKVFAAMFQHEMKENINNVVKIEDVEYDVLSELFRYVYSGIVNNIEKIARPLLIAADKYNLSDLKLECGKHLGEKLTVDNVEDCLHLAERYNVHSLKLKAVDFIISNANEMIHTPRFKPIVESYPDIVVEVVRCLSEKRS